MNIPRRIFKSRLFSRIRTWLDPQSERLRDFVRRCAESLPNGALVIDVGAGECPYESLFVGKRYVGVDFAQGDEDWDYGRLDVVADVHLLPFRDGVADAVLCTQVLEHVHDPQQVVSEIARVLKPGGRAFFTVPQGAGEHQVPHDYFRYTQYGIKVLCSRGGLTVIHTGKTCGLFGYLANRLTMVPKVLFWQIRNPVVRLLLIPAELLSYLIFVVLPPFLVAPFDRLDRDRSYTIDYTIVAGKPEA